MPRSLATDRYTEAQVLDRLSAPGRKIRPRIEVLDRDGNPTGLEGFTPEEYADPRGSAAGFTLLSGSVTFDTTRAVCGSFSFDMLPCDDLADAFLRYLLRPWFGVGPMPDGGYAEYPMGVYLTMLPSREVRAIGPRDRNVEVWTMTCPDQMYLLSIGGPRAAGFRVQAGDALTDAIKNAYIQSGYGFDLSRIEDSGVATTENLSWTWQSGAKRSGRQVTQIVQVPEKRRWKPVSYMFGVTIPAKAYDEPVYGVRYKEVVSPATTRTVVTTVGEEDQETQGSTWLDIIGSFHQRLGWSPPYFGLDGNPVGEPRPNPFEVDNPSLVYEAGPDTMVVGEAKLEPDMDDWANVVIVVQSNSTGPATVGTADLNSLNPSHPLAQRRCKAYKDLFIRDSSTSSAGAASAQALAALLDVVNRTEQLDIAMLLNPAHEGFEIVSFRMPGDRAYDTAQVMSEESWSAGLRTGERRAVWSRAFIDATTVAL